MKDISVSVKMNSIARSLYGGMKLIRILKICVTPAVDVKSTVTCRNLPSVHPWDWTKDPWERLHIDFAGPFMDSIKYF